MKKAKIIFSSVIVVLGVLVSVAPYTFAKVCSVGGTIMKCHWTARAELFWGIATAILAFTKFFFKENSFQLGVNIGIAVNAVGIILFPTVLIGVCGMKSMHCHAVTQPVLIVLGVLIFTAALLHSLVALWKKD